MDLIFDASHFDHMTAGDRALQIEVIGLFRAQVAGWACVLTPETENETCRAAIHTLKGSARGLGLCALARACENAEAAFGPPEGDLAAALADVHDALAAALSALDAFEHG